MNPVHPRTPVPFGMTRRNALRLGGLSAAALGLSACGVQGQAVNQSTKQAESAAQKFWKSQSKHGKVVFANWALYIDPNHQSLKDFTSSTGIKVTYDEVIQDDPSFFAKIHPLLAAGQPSGYDIMVITDGTEFQELVALGEVVPLDQSKMTNFYKYAGPNFKNRAFDPGNVYSMPWQAGSTGIAWNPKYVKEAPTSINDLWNPAYKGHVGMMSDVQEIANFGLFKIGVDPETSKEADWRNAANVLLQQRSAGIVRQYYDQSYINALSKGDVWITMAWSGDIFQQNLSAGTNLQFTVPKEGGTLWMDNMMIPKYAQNPLDAMTLLDWFYKPEIAAMVTEGVNYITPVPSGRSIIQSDAARATGSNKANLTEVATSSLVWPTAAEYARLKNYVQLTSKTRPTFNSIFEPVVAG